MAITKEQWEKIEKELSRAFGYVKLKCDDYEVTLEVHPVASLQYGIVVFVNGKFKGSWIIEDCEERRRFMRPVERFLYGTKYRLDMIRIWGGKRAPKKKVEELNQKITGYFSYWTSVKTLRRHLEKNNKELRLLQISGEVIALPDRTGTMPDELVPALV